MSARGVGGVATTSACRSLISISPPSASTSIESSSDLEKAMPSAVPCTSTKRASPPSTGRNITTFMSTSALLSSTYGRSSIATPSTMPTLIADTNEWSGCFAATSASPAAARSASMVRLSASWSAMKPPQMLAVRVPPSACNTSQSTVTCRSPSTVMSHAARSDRAMSRWISTVRPLCLPLAASRPTRSGDDPGNIEYSAVTHPLPLPRIHRGTSSSTDAVHTHTASYRSSPGTNRPTSR